MQQSIKNCPLVEVIYLPIWFSKNRSFLWNTENADRNGVNNKIYITICSIPLIWNSPFQSKPLLFGLHLPLDYNIWRPSFLKVFKETHITPLQRGISTMRVKENLEKKLWMIPFLGGLAWDLKWIHAGLRHLWNLSV